MSILKQQFYHLVFGVVNGMLQMASLMLGYIREVVMYH